MKNVFRKFTGKFKREPDTPDCSPPLSEQDQVFEEIIAVSGRIQRAERLKQFGKDNDVNVGVSGSDAYIAIKNEHHDELLKRYMALRNEVAND